MLATRLVRVILPKDFYPACMTAQASDQFEIDGVRYSIAAIEREWPFDPTKHGFSPVAPHTGCWRGFIASYVLRDKQLELAQLLVGFGNAHPHAWRGISPEKGEFFKFDRMWAYQDVALPVAYSGGLVVAAGFLREFYVHMGFHRPHCYETVKELIFEDGLLVDLRDHSTRMAAARDMVRAERKVLASDRAVSKTDIEAFVRDAFSLRYEDKWA